MGAELSVQVTERKAGIELPDMIEIKKNTERVLLFEPKLKEKISLKPKKVAARDLATPHGLSKRDMVIFQKRVFGVDNLLNLPFFCTSFGRDGEPVCRFIPEPEDEEWYNMEISDA